MTHIPGPWLLLGDQIESDEVSIARITLVDEPEGAANARLIAAAPGLLAALRTIAGQKTLGELSGAGEDCEGDFEGAYDALIDLARATIKKAESAL